MNPYLPARSCTLLLRAVATAGVVLATGAVSAGSAAYNYDALGRLIKVTYANGVVITYAYDAMGNRTATVVTGAPA